ncbi:uncharacterized protein PAC_06187 [Phialocephala subalpina]|uniref:FAD-binding PCMH-type domain-containing protein n=1 Tax=Phialocephala subalpina TaxID=576137 RepID=A0A1L7WU65_9HELO|nr:uncharacterized protein PAC_06187 [Phialocephala subalpina]
MSSTSEIPLLSERHFGIPQNLLEKAQKAKSLIYETRTKETNTKDRLPVVPQGIEKEVSVKALDELGEHLGKENVEVNDKPLVDGWYMEHEFSGFPEKEKLNMIRSQYPRHDPILEDEELVASAVVYPRSTTEVQKIVLWANKYSISIFPISMGRNRKSPCPPGVQAIKDNSTKLLLDYLIIY